MSRAMAVWVRSCPIMGQLVDNASQIAVVFKQRRDCFGLLPPQAEKHGNLDVTLRALNKFGSIIFGASHDLANDDFCSVKKFCIAGTHAYHEAAIDAAQLDHNGR